MKTSNRNRNGYRIVHLPDHPSAYGDGYVYEHRLVAEEMLGRLLSDEEIVHHKNGNKSDNHPKNLQVMLRREHTAEHNGGALKEIPCAYCGSLFKPTNRKVKCCSITCGALFRQQSKRPCRAVLIELVWRIPSTHIAKLYGVSDRAVGKWCTAYDINKPPRGYWSKIRAGSSTGRAFP